MMPTQEIWSSPDDGRPVAELEKTSMSQPNRSRLVDALITLRKSILPAANDLDADIEAAGALGPPSSALMALVGAKAFRKSFSGLFSGIDYDYRIARIDHDCEPDVLNVLFQRVEQEWSKLGATDAAWSVLSTDRYRQSAMTSIPSSFYESGEREAERVIGSLKRNGIKPPFHNAVEYGCGIARVSVPLSKHCGRLYAYDISPSHLQLARQRAEGLGVTNIIFELVRRPGHPLPSEYDLYYSALVFQHNPPPMMAMLVRQALGGLAPGGVAVLQLPVFRKGYRFRLKDYLAQPGDGVEMHVLPQRVVFDIIRECECHVLDVFETSVNLRDRILSNIFTVQRPQQRG